MKNQKLLLLIFVGFGISFYLAIALVSLTPGGRWENYAYQDEPPPETNGNGIIKEKKKGEEGRKPSSDSSDRQSNNVYRQPSDSYISSRVGKRDVAKETRERGVISPFQTSELYDSETRAYRRTKRMPSQSDSDDRNCEPDVVVKADEVKEVVVFSGYDGIIYVHPTKDFHSIDVTVNWEKVLQTKTFYAAELCLTPQPTWQKLHFQMYTDHTFIPEWGVRVRSTCTKAWVTDYSTFLNIFWSLRVVATGKSFWKRDAPDPGCNPEITTLPESEGSTKPEGSNFNEQFTDDTEPSKGRDVTTARNGTKRDPGKYHPTNNHGRNVAIAIATLIVLVIIVAGIALLVRLKRGSGKPTQWAMYIYKRGQAFYETRGGQKNGKEPRARRDSFLRSRPFFPPPAPPAGQEPASRLRSCNKPNCQIPLCRQVHLRSSLEKEHSYEDLNEIMADNRGRPISPAPSAISGEDGGYISIISDNSHHSEVNPRSSHTDSEGNSSLRGAQAGTPLHSEEGHHQELSSVSDDGDPLHTQEVDVPQKDKCSEAESDTSESSSKKNTVVSSAPASENSMSIDSEESSGREAILENDGVMNEQMRAPELQQNESTINNNDGGVKDKHIIAQELQQHESTVKNKDDGVKEKQTTSKLEHHELTVKDKNGGVKEMQITALNKDDRVKENQIIASKLEHHEWTVKDKDGGVEEEQITALNKDDEVKEQQMAASKLEEHEMTVKDKDDRAKET